jgi:suppressor of G2 allele of SKP1
VTSLAQLSLNVKLPTGSDVVFDLEPLAHPIDVQQSSHRVLAPKIELKLVKKVQGIKWRKIEGDEEGGAVAGATMGEWHVTSAS